MDSNLAIMLVSLLLYIVSLGIASVKKINLRFIATLFVIIAFWFGFQWKSWIGILAAFGGIIIGIVILRITVGNKGQK